MSLNLLNQHNKDFSLSHRVFEPACISFLSQNNDGRHQFDHNKNFYWHLQKDYKPLLKIVAKSHLLTPN